MPVDFESLEPGQEVVRLVKPAVTRVQLARYAGASGDYTRFHLEGEAAREAGLDGVIAHGMLLMGMVAEAVTTWLPQRRIKRIKVRFKGMTRPGDVITVTGSVAGKRIEGGRGLVKCNVRAVDQNDDLKVAGTFEAELPL